MARHQIEAAQARAVWLKLYKRNQSRAYRLRLALEKAKRDAARPKARQTAEESGGAIV